MTTRVSPLIVSDDQFIGDISEKSVMDRFGLYV